MTASLTSNLLDRINHCAREWRLKLDESFETESSVISFVSRDGQALVLKVVKREGDEWRAGEVLEAFNGHGVVRVYEHTGGAMLLERLRPGDSLVETVVNGRDHEATDVLAGVMQQIFSSAIPKRCATIQDWARGFDRYLATGDDQIPKDLVETAQSVFLDLCATQRSPRLLHGDLQHYNVLFDSERSWLAIDPKGVIGEAEYEVGALLRNPAEAPEIFLSRATIERRLKQVTEKLKLDFERTLGWSFAQAVLSAVWEIEDGFPVNATNSSLKLARVIQPMLAW